MKYLQQFFIIIFISFLGELCNYFIPLPIPASIYGLVIMLVCLISGLIKPAQVHDVSTFFIEIMPVMFIPAGVGLIESWSFLKPVLFPVMFITIISTVVVMGVMISLMAYFGGCYLRKKVNLALFHPLLMSIVVTILFLIITKIDYSVYYEGAKYLSYFLTPATVCLAVPLYEQLSLLKKHLKAILLGILSGVLTSIFSILFLSILFHLDQKEYVTLLPKSITTAIGMGVSEELGGYVTITVAVIIITGILGNVLAELVCKLFRITEPIAKGVAGLLTVIFASVFATISI